MTAIFSFLELPHSTFGAIYPKSCRNLCLNARLFLVTKASAMKACESNWRNSCTITILERIHPRTHRWGSDKASLGGGVQYH